MSREEKEKKYRRIGWITSISAQLLMLILFYFLVAWREPDPPIPTYGIELAFGIEESGQGTEPLATPEPAEEATQPDETVEEPMEETQEPVSEPETEEVIEDPISETEQVEESPVTETPTPDEVKPVENKEVTPVEEEETKNKPTEETTKEEVVKEETKKEETVNEEALMPTTEGNPNNSKGDSNTEGAQGKEEGDIDGRALMGEQGNSDGASLNMAGWKWDNKPQPKDDSDESGKIVYRIKVDEEGYLVGIEVVESTVSPVVERYYRQSVERLTFTQTGSNAPAPISTGTVTFIIRSK